MKVGWFPSGRPLLITNSRKNCARHTTLRAVEMDLFLRGYITAGAVLEDDGS